MRTTDLRRPGIIALVSLAIVIVFYILREHWSHALRGLPYVLLACPLLHLFHGHGGMEEARGESRRSSANLVTAPDSVKRERPVWRAAHP